MFLIYLVILKYEYINNINFLVKFTPFARPILCRLNFKTMFLYQFNYCTYYLQGGGAYTLKFNLHIIERVKKGCEFNQKR
jgi:hypothetical protein